LSWDREGKGGRIAFFTKGGFQEGASAVREGREEERESRGEKRKRVLESG
jgi:hypothetical protein